MRSPFFMYDTEKLLIQIKNVSKIVTSGDNNIHILRNINLNIKQSETIAIIGASGSGKTTLLTLLAGLDLPTSGEIIFEGQALHLANDELRTRIRADFVGFVFQSFQLLPNLTALENVMLPMEIQYIPNSVAKAEASTWLKKVGLEHRLHHYPGKLSGGEQQRVAIARAFVNKRKVIFADEMTGNLDPKTGKQIIELLFDLNQDYGTTLVLVTHDAELAARCQRQISLADGELHPC